MLFSLFEEQFVASRPVEPGRPWSALSARAFAIDTDEFAIKPPDYLDFIRRTKQAVNIPVIASLNVSTPDRWIQYATLMEQAGADAIELDLYTVPADPTISGEMIEKRHLEILTAVRGSVTIPIAVKLAPYFTSMASVANRLDDGGADGLVLFNRFYQPTIDIEERRIVTSLELSDSYDGRLPLMWIATLSGQVSADLAATGGVHTTEDAVRMFMAGAAVVMLCSALLRHGIPHLSKMAAGVCGWLDAHGCTKLEEIRGVMSLARCTNPDDFKRAGYAKVLNRYW